jgi:hypothetical protein
MNDSWGGQREPALSRADLKSHMMTNWRKITADIDALPISKFDPKYNKERVLPSISLFIDDCEGLPPLEYLDFLDQMLVLYEQKRISDDAFEHAFLPSLEKQDFLSVNYSHPRMAAILQKAISLTPHYNDDLKSCFKDMVSGALADNYMTDRSDDAPLPETLPGVKLKRPWGSILRKYERLTGKKVPPDPGFPDEDQTRPPRRPQANAVGNGFNEGGAPTNDRSMSPAIWVAAGLACLAAVAAIGTVLQRKNRGNR